MRSTLLAIAAALALLGASAANAGGESLGSRPPGPGDPPQMISGWAYPANPAAIRKNPAASAPGVGRIRFTTELGNAEVYEISARVVGGDGEMWLRVDIPGRPNGRFGWVREDVLGSQHTVSERLVISRSKLRATLYRGGKRIFSARVGIGKAGTQTPAGDFYIREATKIGGAGGAYGPFAFGTSAYSPGLTDWPQGGVIGIHGTDEPDLVPGRISHGCIRLRNRDIQRLRRLLDVGARLRIT